MRDLALYLARKQADYKFGLPFHTKSPEIENFLFVFENAGQDKEKDNKEFVNSIIEKGLKLKVQNQSLLVLEGSDKKVTDVKQKYQGQTFKAVIIFGEGLVEKLNTADLKVIAVPSIEKVREDQSIKKQFWNILKEL